MLGKTWLAKLVLGILLAIWAVPIGLRVQSASATHPGGPIKIRHIGHDEFRTYDFHSENVDPEEADWPVTLVFTGYVDIGWVKKVFRNAFPYHFTPGVPITVPNDIGKTPQYARLSDARVYANGDVEKQWTWDTDKGLKTVACAPDPAYASHIRIYAPPFYSDSGGPLAPWEKQPDVLYDKTLGYYVFATSHQDHNECGGTKYFGYSERVENLVVLEAAKMLNEGGKGVGAIYPDRIWMANREGNFKNGNLVSARYDGDKRWFNDGWASRINLVPMATSASATPRTVDEWNLYPSGALTRYVKGEHWASTGTVPTAYAVDKVLGYLEQQPMAGTAPIYECSNGSDNFLSRDISCGTASLLGRAGWVYTSSNGTAPLGLYSCRQGTEIFESVASNCEGNQVRGVLGYIKETGRFRRYRNGGYHMVTTGARLGSFSLEFDYGSLLRLSTSNTHPLYGCQNKSNSNDFFISLSRTCENQLPLGLEGYAYNSPPGGGVPVLQIYRCLYSGGHYVSSQANCEGYKTESSLGYTLSETD